MTALRSVFFAHHLDAAGIGVVECGADRVVSRLNSRAQEYLRPRGPSFSGRRIAVLKKHLRSDELWRNLYRPGEFTCLAAGHNRLFLVSTLRSPGPGTGGAVTILFRPYSLEREFILMRSRFSRNLSFEIGAMLNSISVAGEIILQPELADDTAVRSRFLASFSDDLQALQDHYHRLMETAAPLPVSTRVHPSPIDLRSLLADLSTKMSGWAAEKSVTLTTVLPRSLPAVRGDYDWLLFSLFGALSHVIEAAPPLGEVRLRCTVPGAAAAVTIATSSPEAGQREAWPPRTLYTHSPGEPRPHHQLPQIALSRIILQMHGGGLDRSRERKRYQLVATIPA